MKVCVVMRTHRRVISVRTHVIVCVCVCCAFRHSKWARRIKSYTQRRRRRDDCHEIAARVRAFRLRRPTTYVLLYHIHCAHSAYVRISHMHARARACFKQIRVSLFGHIARAPRERGQTCLYTQTRAERASERTAATGTEA